MDLQRGPAIAGPRCHSPPVSVTMRSAALLFVMLLVPPHLVSAQSHSAAPRNGAYHRASCDRVATSSFTFGRTGGNIRPDGFQLDVDGTLSRLTPGAPATRIGTVPRDAVRAIARLAWTNGFAALPSSPTHPTRNPDAAREFVDVRSTCASRHVEYAAGEEAPAFREVRSLLDLTVARAR